MMQSLQSLWWTECGNFDVQIKRSVTFLAAFFKTTTEIPATHWKKFQLWKFFPAAVAAIALGRKEFPSGGVDVPLI